MLLGTPVDLTLLMNTSHANGPASDESAAAGAGTSRRASQATSNPEKHPVTVYVNKDVSAEFVIRAVREKLNKRRRKQAVGHGKGLW